MVAKLTLLYAEMPPQALMRARIDISVVFILGISDLIAEIV